MPSAAAPLTTAVAPVRECRLVQGVAALSAQIVLLCIVVTVLIIKRQRERPRRPWNTWSLDVSKQAFSGTAGHLCGMAIAIVAHHRSGASSQCGWYLVVYGLDTTLGITAAILLHRAANAAAVNCHYARQRQLYNAVSGKGSEEHQPGSAGSGTGRDSCEADDWGNGGWDTHGTPHPWWQALVEIGNYGEPPSIRKWAIQVALWVLCVVTARLLVGSVVISCIPFFAGFTVVLEARFQGHPDLLLFFVMVGVPLLLNVAQAWIQDQFLKWKHRGPKLNRRGSEADAQLVGKAGV